jgi:hypothetical protein
MEGFFVGVIGMLSYLSNMNWARQRSVGAEGTRCSEKNEAKQDARDFQCQDDPFSGRNNTSAS